MWSAVTGGDSHWLLLTVLVPAVMTLAVLGWVVVVISGERVRTLVIKGFGLSIQISAITERRSVYRSTEKEKS